MKRLNSPPILCSWKLWTCLTSPIWHVLKKRAFSTRKIYIIKFYFLPGTKQSRPSGLLWGLCEVHLCKKAPHSLFGWRAKEQASNLGRLVLRRTWGGGARYSHSSWERAKHSRSLSPVHLWWLLEVSTRPSSLCFAEKIWRKKSWKFLDIQCYLAIGIQHTLTVWKKITSCSTGRQEPERLGCCCVLHVPCTGRATPWLSWW